MLKDRPLPLKMNHAATTELLAGDEVLQLLSENDFRNQWALLYEKCAWTTVFQSIEFVANWYGLYRDTYLPILVKTEVKGELVGLLPLTLFKKKSGNTSYIMGAGSYEADYHCWLATPENSNEFIDAALTNVMSRFPEAHIILRHLPPGVSLDWLSTEKTKWRHRSVLYSLTRPLIVMSDFRVSKRDRKRVRQVEAIGSFQKLADEDEFASVLNKLATYYDFRQAAMFNKTPFRADARRKDFLLALFREGLLHVTTITHKDAVVASVAALISKNQANLGAINLHSPFFTKYSPGFVHFLMLNQLFMTEGIESFDLTPGGDPYKERLATQHDPVKILVITNSRTFLLKRKIKKLIHQFLEKKGMRPMATELLLDKRLHPIKERGILPVLIKKLNAAFTNGRQRRLYYGKAEALQGDYKVKVHRNCLEDLLNFAPARGGITRWEFLEDAMQRYEKGESSYTWAERGQLMACAWLPANAASPAAAAFATVLDGLYFKVEEQAMVQPFLAGVLQEVLAGKDPEALCAITEPEHKFIARALLQAGFNTTA